MNVNVPDSTRFPKLVRVVLVLATVGVASLWLWSGCRSRSARLAQDRPTAFVGLSDLSDFTREPGTAPGELILTSSSLKSPIPWDELVVSWNTAPGVALKVEARTVYPDHSFADHFTKYYTLGLWSDDPSRNPRESRNQQRDSDGTVKVDTLVLSKPTENVQLRLTLTSTNAAAPARELLHFVGLSFCNSKVHPAPAAPNRAAWGRVIPVPERRQAEYEGGSGWCSPTSLSMVMAYWSEDLKRPELNQTVPEVAHAIDDASFGTGNWPFNTAYAGEFPGLRAYVSRFNDVSELEDWIAAGIPPIVSVSSYLINNRNSGPDAGHLIVCVGFTSDGDVVTNDPGVSVKRNERARRIYPRERFVNAWKKSKNAVYLIYPETTKPPPNRAGDWLGK